MYVLCWTVVIKFVNILLNKNGGITGETLVNSSPTQHY